MTSHIHVNHALTTTTYYVMHRKFNRSRVLIHFIDKLAVAYFLDHPV